MPSVSTSIICWGHLKALKNVVLFGPKFLLVSGVRMFLSALFILHLVKHFDLINEHLLLFVINLWLLKQWADGDEKPLLWIGHFSDLLSCVIVASLVYIASINMYVWRHSQWDAGWRKAWEAKIKLTFCKEMHPTYLLFCKVAGALTNFLNFKMLQSFTLDCIFNFPYLH